MDLTLKLLLFFTSGFLLVQDVRSFVNGGICGRKFTDKTGSIEYPVVNKRNQYSTLPPKCSFLIAQPPNKTIILEIDYLVISDLTANCQNNRLEIRDGNTTNSTLLKKFCGSNTVRTLLPIVSKQNFLLIELITDGKLSNVGFRANYSTTDAECGVVERLSPGSIEIPGTSKDWVFDSNCIWVIRAPLGHAVELSWPVFNLEDPGNVDYCKNDYVEIYEGSRMSKTGFTGRYCFLFKPPRVQQSQGQDMTIHFRSSKFMSRQTFKATYNFVDVSKTCQGVYYANEGIITTPNHPMNYPDNASCLWILKAPLKHLISLSIPSFDVEYEPNCEKDYLEIRSGGNEDAPFLGRFCGNEAPDNITSYTNEMYIKFVSDSSSNYKGFSITWDSKVEGCGGVLQGPSGIIASPNYPEPYLPSVKQRTLFCSWFIHASAGSTIQFTFLDLDIEDTHDCEYDYVSISEIVGEHSVAPVRYCGKNTLPTVNTTANEARVSLHGFAQTKSRGFRLKYTTGK